MLGGLCWLKNKNFINITGNKSNLNLDWKIISDENNNLNHKKLLCRKEVS